MQLKCQNGSNGLGDHSADRAKNPDASILPANLMSVSY